MGDILEALKHAVAKDEVSRTQFETLIWEFADSVFGPRQSEVAGTMIGHRSETPGWDGTYDFNQDVLKVGKEAKLQSGGSA